MYDISEVGGELFYWLMGDEGMQTMMKTTLKTMECNQKDVVGTVMRNIQMKISIYIFLDYLFFIPGILAIISFIMFMTLFLRGNKAKFNFIETYITEISY